jgi:signal peptidase I
MSPHDRLHRAAASATGPADGFDDLDDLDLDDIDLSDVDLDDDDLSDDVFADDGAADLSPVRARRTAEDRDADRDDLDRDDLDRDDLDRDDLGMDDFDGDDLGADDFDDDDDDDDDARPTATRSRSAAAFGSTTTIRAARSAPNQRTAAGGQRRARPKRQPGRVVLEYVFLGLFALLLASVIRALLGLAFYIPSESMVPTLQINDRVIVSRPSYWRNGPSRGDIVVFRNPKYDGDLPSNVVERTLSNAMEVVGVGQPRDKFYIKRVIGLPGDRIEGKQNAVWINGAKLSEPWLPCTVQIDDFAAYVVEPDHYFMMGDNRTNSADSRFDLGTIRRSAIVGEAVVRIWPPARMGGLDIIQGPSSCTPTPGTPAVTGT